MVRNSTRYLFSIAAVACAVVLRLWLIPLTGTGASFVLFFTAVMVTSLLAGIGPGACALLLSLSLGTYEFAIRAGYPLYQAVFQSLLFGVDGTMVLYLAFRLKQSREGLEETNRRLHRANQVITKAESRERELSEQRRVSGEREELLAGEQLARQKAESTNEPLRESEERFRLTIDEAPIGMALVSLDGRFVRVNRALCEIVGYSPDELTMLTFQAITHPDDVGADMAAARRLGRGEISRYHVEKRYIRKDRSTVDVLLSVSVLRGHNGAPLYFISQIQDITDRKRIEEALRRAVTERDQVLGIVAHDLRNPLTSIMQSAALAQRDPEPERLNSRLDVILRATKRMNQLIQGLLDVALIEEGHLRIKSERVRTADLVLDAVAMQAPLASASGLEVRVNVMRARDDLWGNRERLEEVFENLIGNAIKFTEAGGHITVGAASREQDVLFWVADTGRGIARENLPHIFDRFWQAVPRGGRLAAGLGLAITKGIVEAHGGHIWAKSTPGLGSTFFFTVPKALPDVEHPKQAA